MVHCRRCPRRFDTAQILAVVLFMAFYSAFILYMVGPRSNDCLSVRDFTAQLSRYQIPVEYSVDLLHGLAADKGQKSTPDELKAPAGDDVEVSDEVVDAEKGADRKQLPHKTSSKTLNEKLPDGKSDGVAAAERQFFVYDSLPIDSLLKADYIPNNVYYFWCGRRWFEFNHYLSVRSVIRHLRPDNLIFIYDNEPVVDDWTYNTWFSELQSEYPFFRLYQVNLTRNEPACLEHNQPNYSFISSVLAFSGGTYVNEHVILADYPIELRHQDLVMAFNPGQPQGEQLPVLLSTRPRILPDSVPPKQLASLLNDRSKQTRRLDCSNIAGYVSANRKPKCVIVDDVPRLFPRDIWNRTDSFGRLVRTIFYGTPKILRPVQRYDELIPNVAHIVWLGGGEMDFLFYLCVNSLIYTAQVDAVYIHGDGPPGGGYWHLIKGHPKVHLIHRDHPRTIYGTPVNVVSHVTDIWRVDFMVKYGGIYVDTDTVFIRPLDREIRSYDAVGTYDWTYWNHPFPDTINFGVALGKRNAPYWHKFQESMKWFQDRDWSWNGLRQPYRIKERHPDLVLIDPHLQVTCYKSLCHPTWHPDYHNESVHHVNSNSIQNWRTDTYAFHWTLPTPFELLDHVHAIKSQSMFAEIAVYILDRAGMLEYFRDLVRTNRAHFDVKRPPFKV